MDSARRGEAIPLLPWGLIGVVTVPLSILAVVTYCRIFPPILFGDVAYYSAALPALISDAPLYDPASLQPHVLPPPPFWDQAPSTAILVSVLLLPAGNVIWGLAMFACVVAGIAILMPRLSGGVVLWAPVVVALPAVIETMAWANANALVFLMIAIAWRWPRRAGLAIGIATAAKALPVLLVAWLVGRRDGRGMAVALAVPVALTVATMALTDPSVVIDFVVVRFNQQVDPNGMGFGLADMGVPEPLTWLLALALTAIAAWKASFSVAVLALVVAAPSLYLHYMVFLLVPALGIWVPWVIARSGQRHPDPGLAPVD